MKTSLKERFEAKYVPEPNSGCWLWTGAATVSGYGLIYWDGKYRLATHASLYLSDKPLQNGKCALHRCDNSFCVNPDHLFSGSRKENVRDMIEKKRDRYSGKVDNCKTHLMPKARHLFLKGWCSLYIAQALGIDRPRVTRWITRFKKQ